MLKYVARTLNLEIVFQKDSENDIVGYSDLDYVKVIDGRKYTIAYILCLQAGQFLTSHNSSLQLT